MPDVLQEALSLAVELHRGTDRDGDVPLPYACHVVEVVANLRLIGQVTDLDVLTAAFLHDTVEDTGLTLVGVAARFGPRVAQIVGEVTREEPSSELTTGMSKDEVWRLRHDLFEVEIQAMSDDAKRIKLADRLSNLKESNLTRKGEKVHRYRWQSQRILGLINRDVNPPLWDALEAEILANPIPNTSKWAE
jgi:guanosine-3',5'-bis(diphosphate) 3'-pyrophosphohydrolase